MRPGSVRIGRRGVRVPSGPLPRTAGPWLDGRVLDLAYVVLTLVVFAALAALVAGLERL